MNAIADPLERALDAALAMTFPASDPVAVWMPEHVERADPAIDSSERLTDPLEPARAGDESGHVTGLRGAGSDSSRAGT
jgi:hypothetical protein